MRFCLYMKDVSERERQCEEETRGKREVGMRFNLCVCVLLIDEVFFRQNFFSSRVCVKTLTHASLNHLITPTLPLISLVIFTIFFKLLFSFFKIVCKI